MLRKIKTAVGLAIGLGSFAYFAVLLIKVPGDIWRDHWRSQRALKNYC